MDTNNSLSNAMSGNRQSKGLQKIENRNVVESNNHLKLPPKYIEISWQTYRVAAFILFALACGVMKYIVDFFSEKINDNELINILKIISFFFILNFGTFLFITVYYKYRKSVKGAKGPKGNEGKRGHQGNPSYCNICEKKTGGFKKEYKNKPMKEEIVPSLLMDFSRNTKPYWKIMEHKIRVDRVLFRLMTPGFMGPGKPKDAVVKNILYPSEEKVRSGIDASFSSVDPFVNQVKPIIGVSVSFNKETGEFYSILFFKDRNRFHNPQRYKFKPLGGTIGRQEKMGVGVEFKCPKNSAIYKVELFHNGSIIVSMRLFCANVETGEHINVIDPMSNKKRKYATIGKPISKNDNTYISEVIKAGHFVARNNMYQSFFSQVAADVDEETGKIYSIGFLRSSIYMNGFNLK